MRSKLSQISMFIGKGLNRDSNIATALLMAWIANLGINMGILRTYITSDLSLALSQSVLVFLHLVVIGGLWYHIETSEYEIDKLALLFIAPFSLGFSVYSHGLEFYLDIGSDYLFDLLLLGILAAVNILTFSVWRKIIEEGGEYDE